MPDKLSLLKRYWGHTAFRPLQEEIVDSVLEGNDTMVLLPTGGGKTLCYQLPALMTEGLCLVVSPLIALMKDQVQRLNDLRLKAACIVSGMSRSDVSAVLTNCLCGTVKFLYVSPERLQQRLFIEHFRKMKVCLIAVDEAHCVSQWGYDFRPPYLQIAALREYHPEVPMIALTATATPAVVDDIKQRLMLRNPRHFQSSFARANLCYSVVYDDNKIARLLRIVKETDGSGIVYTRSRRATQQVADQLNAEGIAAAYYHAGLEAKERDRRQLLWMQNKCRVMVATNAFGMGIDKPDVRFVVHLDVPESLEAYFQEAGRAGRDGESAKAVLLCGSTDTTTLEHHFENDFPTIKYIRNAYRALCNYYKIPMGSGADSRFDFQLEEVCGSYGFYVRDFYSACRFLERAGLVALPDREDAYSSLFVIVGRDELYRLQVDNIPIGNLLQVLLRMYPGLLSEPVPIDERKIATRSLLDVGQVMAMLMQLHAMHVVEYRPRPTKPQIIFTSPRVNDQDISFDESDYDGLKAAARQRLDAVKAYIGNTTVCRSRQLLAYFGETEGVLDCGRCDVCMKGCRKETDVATAIINELKRGKQSPQALQQLLENKGYGDVIEVLREMLDRKEVYLDPNMLLSLS